METTVWSCTSAFDDVFEPGKYMSIERQEPLRNLGMMIARIRATGGTGRLALRNTVRVGMLHLYFEHGQLVHLVGSRASIDDALIDLAGWSDGVIRFDMGVLPERQTVTPAQQEFFHRTLLMLQQRDVVERVSPPAPFSAQPEKAAPPQTGLRSLRQRTPARLPIVPTSSQGQPAQPDPMIDAFLPPGTTQRAAYHPPSEPQGRKSRPLPPAAPAFPGTAEVLLSARQWELLVEVVNAMLEGVGQLFGQRQAQNILQHVLMERGEESKVLELLQVDRQGWLREVRLHEMMTQPVQDVASAFVLLISDFERRCAGLLGEEKARQMIARALYPYHDGLAEIGIALN